MAKGAEIDRIKITPLSVLANKSIKRGIKECLLIEILVFENHDLSLNSL